MSTDRPSTTPVWVVLLVLVAMVSAAIVSYSFSPSLKPEETGEADDPSGHGHSHGTTGAGAHAQGESLQLNEVAWRNLGLKTGTVQPSDYERTVAVSARIVERPGRTQVDITAPFTGIVERVHIIEGEALLPGTPLFDLRLTHEDLVTAQREYLRSAQELDVVKREIKRLESVGDGVIAGRRVLEHEYEQEKLEATMHAQQQGLLLHGLTERQIASILQTRKLIPLLTVLAPPFNDDEEANGARAYHVQKILAKRGESVTSGHGLALLADHRQLFVEGQAFEDDAARLTQAAKAGWKLRVTEFVGASQSAKPMNLRVLYVADQIDMKSRALRFYMGLPNEVIRDERVKDHRFIAWRFRPGQRMEVRLPIGQKFKGQIVLPKTAVVDEGAQSFVFEQNGSHFDRVPVSVLYRDREAIVVENDGRLLGSTIAFTAAYEMHLAIKNQSGGAIDPHAGHTH